MESLKKQVKLVHPAEDPTYRGADSDPVWYLAHPLAPDTKMSYEENMEDTLEWLKFLWNNGFRVVAPWHTLCLVLDDTKQKHRTAGLEADCYTVQQLGRIILTGHRYSKGMAEEFEALRTWFNREQLSSFERRARAIDLIGLNFSQAADVLQSWKREHL